MKRLSLLILSSVLATGCANPPERVPEKPAKQYIEIGNKSERVKRNLTLSWDNMGRGGAAIRQPAYVHVLGDGNLGAYENEGSMSGMTAHPDSSAPDIAAALKAADEVGAKTEMNDTSDSNGLRGHSVYELQRWERFCDGGKGMDEADWSFVTNSGSESGLPDIYQNNCDTPKHDYGSYLAAWTGFCTNVPISRVQRLIVQNSSRPKSTVNPCEAL
jgi:hypothetical protein